MYKFSKEDIASKAVLAVAIMTALLNSCSTRDTKFQQYYVQGEQLYIKNCSNCHQKNGTGLGLVYPPLHTSDFMDSHFKEVVCLMKYGREGELMVNGKSFNKAMKGVPSLTDLEIAEIATYIYNTWGREKGMVETARVSEIIATCEH